MRDQSNDFNELESKIGEATMKKIVKIRDFLNKLNLNAGFPGKNMNFTFSTKKLYNRIFYFS